MDILELAIAPLPPRALPFVLAAFESSNFVDFAEGVLTRLDANGFGQNCALTLGQLSLISTSLSSLVAQGVLPRPRENEVLQQWSAALSPLLCWTLPFVLAAFHQASSTGFAEAVRATWPLHRVAVLDAVTEPLLAEVLERLHLLSRRGLVPPPRTPRATSPLCVLPAHRHCSLCNNDLYLQPARVARMLAYKSGIEEVLFRVGSCEACGLCYLGCMSYKSSGDLYLCSDPGSAAVLPWAMPSQAPATSSECPFLFVQAELLRFLSLAIVHWRASLRGFERIWAAFFDQKLTHRLRRRLLRAWMFWQVQCLLWDTPAQPDAVAVPLPLDVRLQDTVEACWVQLTKHMRAWFLDRYARQHACPLCLRFATVGVDNKVNLATRVCGYAEGGVRQYPATHVSVSFGCTLPPRPRSAYCAQHATCFTADPVASDVTPRCCNGHDLQLSSVNSETYIFTCDVCSATLAKGLFFGRVGMGASMTSVQSA